VKQRESSETLARCNTLAAAERYERAVPYLVGTAVAEEAYSRSILRISMLLYRPRMHSHAVPLIDMRHTTLEPQSLLYDACGSLSAYYGAWRGVHRT
jgi:hypothetical protein